MSDGLRFLVSKNTKGYVFTRERGVIPGILKAQDIFVQELDERGDVRFVIKNKSAPYIRGI